jgi:hypothetical protein
MVVLLEGDMMTFRFLSFCGVNGIVGIIGTILSEKKEIYTIFGDTVGLINPLLAHLFRTQK